MPKQGPRLWPGYLEASGALPPVQRRCLGFGTFAFDLLRSEVSSGFAWRYLRDYATRTLRHLDVRNSTFAHRHIILHIYGVLVSPIRPQTALLSLPAQTG